MFEGYGKGPICPMCKKVAVELKEVNGQKACISCKKKIKRGQEIIVHKPGKMGITKVEQYHIAEHKKEVLKKEAEAKKRKAMREGTNTISKEALKEAVKVMVK